jgi:hypothetical protein
MMMTQHMHRAYPVDFLRFASNLPQSFKLALQATATSVSLCLCTLEPSTPSLDLRPAWRR